MEFCPFRLSPSASRVVPMPNGHLEPRAGIVEPPPPFQNPSARRAMAYKVLRQWLRYISFERVQRLQAVLCRLRLLDVRIRDVAPVRQLVAHYLAAPAPQLHRKPLDEVCTALRALHRTLPLARVRTATTLSGNGDSFARRYGVRLERWLQDAGAFSAEGVLQLEKAAKVLSAWLLQMAAPENGSGNAFHWEGFWITETEASCLCESALEHAAHG